MAALALPAAATDPFNPPKGVGMPADPVTAAADASALSRFIDRAAPLCRSAPAPRCVDAGWRFAAERPAAGLSVADLERLRRRLGAWFAAEKSSLGPRTRGAVMLGMLLADGVGAPRLHAAFDADGNGRVSRAELLADVRLDSRPLGTVLADPHAVDRAGLARRLDLPPALIDSVFAAALEPGAPPPR